MSYRGDETLTLQYDGEEVYLRSAATTATGEDEDDVESPSTTVADLKRFCVGEAFPHRKLFGLQLYYGGRRLRDDGGATLADCGVPARGALLVVRRVSSRFKGGQ